VSITAERKHALITEYATKEGDTGSPEIQVAVLSERIRNLTDHLTTHKKDFHSRRGLLVMVGQRRRLLDYLKRSSATRYETLIGRLGLRRCPFGDARAIDYSRRRSDPASIEAKRAKRIGRRVHTYCTGLSLPRLLAAAIAPLPVIFPSKRMISNVPSLS